MSTNHRRLFRRVSSHLDADVSENFIEEGSIVHSVVRSPKISKFGKKNRAKNGTANGTDSSEDEPRPWISFMVVYTMIFFNGCCFTAVVPSVPFYLQILSAPPSFLGWVVSFYSLGQIFGSPIGGWLADKVSSRTLLTISSSLGFLSSAIYSVAPSYWFILLARLLTGMSAGMEFSVELTFIARNTTKKERTVFLASVTAVNVVGFILGPALGGLIAMMDFTIMGVTVDKYTGPGWLLAVMFIVDIVMVQFLFKDNTGTMANPTDTKQEESAKEEQQGLLENKEGDSAAYGGMDDVEEEDLEAEEAAARLLKSMRSSLRPPATVMVLGLIFVQFTVMCAWSVLETITSPLAQDNFGWDVQQCNLLFTGGGFVSLCAYGIFVVASKWVQDRWLIIYALVLCFIGQMLAIDWQLFPWVPSWLTDPMPPYLHRFLTGYALMNAGFMTGRPVTFALYSKLIGSTYQGKYLGWMVAGGSLARTLGPFFAVAVYYHAKKIGINLLALFGTVGLFHVACLTLVIYQFPVLLPRTQMSIRSISDSDRMSIGSSIVSDFPKKNGVTASPGLPGKRVQLSFRTDTIGGEKKQGSVS